MNRVYYNQADSRWANHPYPSPSLPNATIKSGGCGPTSGAMVVSSLVQTITPQQMGDLFRANGHRVNGGTAGSAFPWIGKTYGIECNTKVKLDDAISCLKRGGMVVANVKAGGVFSTGGHFIVLSYMKDDNTIAVYDPYMYTNKFNTSFRKNKVTVSGNTVFISYQNMKDYGNYSYLYCFEPKPGTVQESTKPQTQPKFDGSKRVEVTIPVADTGARSGSLILVENKNMDNGDRKQFWIHESVVENGNIVHGLGDICYIEQDSYIVQIFNEQFWCKEENMKAVEPNPIKIQNQPSIPNTVGQIKIFKSLTNIFENSNLTGKNYNYKANTKVIVQQNISSTIDKIKVVQTGRIGYVNKNSYK